MATRSRAQSSSSRADEVEYFLVIQGLSPHCRWQELKDVIRRIPPDGHIRQAYTDNGTGTVFGYITILNKKKAFDAYDYLYTHGWRGHNIRLTLNVKDENDPESSLRTLCGPEASLVHATQRLHPTGMVYSPQSSSLLPSPVLPISVRENGGRGSTATYTNLGASPIAPMYQPAMQISTQPVLPVQQPATHIYNSYPPSAVPVSQRLISPSSPTNNNTAHYHHKNSVHRPVSKTSTPSSGRGSLSSTSNEGRTVYVYNLPYTVSQQALKDHLAPAGVVDRCLVKEDRQRSSKYKLTAVATFRTPQQAQTAIDRFNRSVWKGYEIKVKLDRGPTTSGASGVKNSKSSARGKEDQRESREGPLVVNGSGPRISSRQARVDSDDESSCDDEEVADLSRRSRSIRI